MFDVIAPIILLFVVWSIGSSFLLCLKGEKLSLIAPIIGFSIYALCVNTLYFVAKISVPMIQIVMCFVTFFCIIYIIKFKISDLLKNKWQYFLPLLICTASYIIACLPGILGGEQYMVFRGNIWDHFNYISSALARYQFPHGDDFYTFINTSLDTQFQYQTAYNVNRLLNLRPMAYILYAMVLTQQYSDIIVSAFFFISFFIALCFSAVVFLLSVIFGFCTTIPRIIFYSLVAFCFTFGFFGQLNFDLNAWSQSIASPVLITLTAFFLYLLQKIQHFQDWMGYGIVVLLASAGFVIYPEATVAFCAIYSCVLLLHIIRERPQLSGLSWALLLAVPFCIMVLAVLPNYDGVLSFLVKQTQTAMGKSFNWWMFFDSYWAGRAPLETFWGYFNAVVGFLGLHLLGVNPAEGVSKILLHSFVVMTTSLLIIFSIAGSWFHYRYQTSIIKDFWNLAAFSLCVVIVFMIGNRLWVAGKIVVYFSPFFVIYFATLPLINFKNKVRCESEDLRFQKFRAVIESSLFLKTIFIATFTIFTVYNMYFYYLRIHFSTSSSGIGLVQNYPSIQDPNHKNVYQWNFNPEDYKTCQRVNIFAEDPFYLFYMKLKLEHKKIPYYTKNKIYTYYVTEPYKIMPEMPYDCTVEVKPHIKSIEDLTSIVEALEKYYKDHGAYPVSQGFDGVTTLYGASKGALWIDGLVPTYLPKLPRDNRLSENGTQEYLYRSDGKDFKLISHASPSIELIAQKRPEMIDPVRPSYAAGFWTEKAKEW